MSWISVPARVISGAALGCKQDLQPDANVRSFRIHNLLFCLIMRRTLSGRAVLSTCTTFDVCVCVCVCVCVFGACYGKYLSVFVNNVLPPCRGDGMLTVLCSTGKKIYVVNYVSFCDIYIHLMIKPL